MSLGLLVVLTFALASCQSEPDPVVLVADHPIAFVDTTLEFPYVQFADGQVSLNDRCPVRRVKLNRRMPPIYVNGRPVGFC